MPGWRLPFEAVLGWEDPSKQEQVLSTQKERGGFSDAANGEVMMFDTVYLVSCFRRLVLWSSMQLFLFVCLVTPAC